MNSHEQELGVLRLIIATMRERPAVALSDK